jgi:hypothetical protein
LRGLFGLGEAGGGAVAAARGFGPGRLRGFPLARNRFKRPMVVRL